MTGGRVFNQYGQLDRGGIAGTVRDLHGDRIFARLRIGNADGGQTDPIGDIAVDDIICRQSIRKRDDAVRREAQRLRERKMRRTVIGVIDRAVENAVVGGGIKDRIVDIGAVRAGEAGDSAHDNAVGNVTVNIVVGGQTGAKLFVGGVYADLQRETVRDDLRRSVVDR